MSKKNAMCICMQLHRVLIELKIRIFLYIVILNVCKINNIIKNQHKSILTKYLLFSKCQGGSKLSRCTPFLRFCTQKEVFILREIDPSQHFVDPELRWIYASSQTAFFLKCYFEGKFKFYICLLPLIVFKISHISNFTG